MTLSGIEGLNALTGVYAAFLVAFLGWVFTTKALGGLYRLAIYAIYYQFALDWNSLILDAEKSFRGLTESMATFADVEAKYGATIEHVTRQQKAPRKSWGDRYSRRYIH